MVNPAFDGAQEEDTATTATTEDGSGTTASMTSNGPATPGDASASGETSTSNDTSASVDTSATMTSSTATTDGTTTEPDPTTGGPANCTPGDTN